jgi:hypothetical protein
MPDGRVKDAALEALLKTHHSDGARVIVFCLYKKEAERVEQTLLRKVGLQLHFSNRFIQMFSGLEVRVAARRQEPG